MPDLGTGLEINQHKMLIFLNKMRRGSFRPQFDSLKRAQSLFSITFQPMASGLDKHQDRLNTLSLFGKDLARRCKSKCELCENGGIKLAPYEVEPMPPEPDFENCLMICETCTEQVSKPKKFTPGEQWRCLAQVVWSEIPALQVTAVRLLRRMESNQDWARETLEGVFLDEEIEEWVTKAD